MDIMTHIPRYLSFHEREWFNALGNHITYYNFLQEFNKKYPPPQDWQLEMKITEFNRGNLTMSQAITQIFAIHHSMKTPVSNKKFMKSVNKILSSKERQLLTDQLSRDRE